MQRRNILLLMPLILILVSCSLFNGQMAEERMNNARSAAFEVAANIGIKNEDLLSEEENCDLTGCFQQFYFATELTNERLQASLTSSTRFSWNINVSTFVPAITKPYIDPYAKQIQLIDGKAPALEPSKGANTLDGITVKDRFFMPWLVLYITANTPSTYTCKGNLINQNILRISFQATKLSRTVTVTTGP